MKISIKIPFDRHGHLREPYELLGSVLIYTLKQFRGMLVMPNLKDPITTLKRAQWYKREIRKVQRGAGYKEFDLVMTAYLTDNIKPNVIADGFKKKIWGGAKLYPHGATTNSNKGVSKLENIFPVLEVMEEIGMPALIHPETEGGRHEIPFIDRERVYVEESLTEIHKRFPNLIISVEHISTKEACQFVESCPENVVATVTPQHIMYNIDAIFHGGVPPYKPGAYVENVCLPILKTQSDVDYIRNAIMYGKKKHKFGDGTDTAPHTQEAKHSHGSCCGVFNSPYAVEFYAMVFDQMGMFKTTEGIKTFENFMSVNNLWIYGLEPSEETITLVKEDQVIPEILPGNLRPFKAGQTIPWKLIPIQGVN